MSKMRSEDYSEGYWERAEGSNYRNYANDPGWAPTASILSTLVPASAKVLEIGAAKGYLVSALRCVGLDAYGVDISEYAIYNCYPNSREFLTLANAVDLPYTDSQFDAVVSMEMLEHVYKDEIDNVLNEMQRAAKEDAIMVHRICLKDVHMEPDNDHTHVTVETREWWEDKFSSRGWRKLEEQQFNVAFQDRDWKGRFFVWATR